MSEMLFFVSSWPASEPAIQNFRIYSRADARVLGGRVKPGHDDDYYGLLGC